MKIVFGTVIYEQAWVWWNEFAESLNNQTENNFDVLILNDGVSYEKISLMKNKIQKKVFVYNIDETISISENRIQLLRVAKKMGYDLLIMGDFDDTFSKNRVETIVNNWNSNVSFYYNNLQYENSDEVVFSNLPMYIDDIKQILECNYLGLSNTALNLKMLTKEFLDSLEDVKTNIFDWYLFSRILIKGGIGQLVNNTNTIYRQQDNSLAGIQSYDSVAIRKEIAVKKEHYRLLSKDLDIAEMLMKRYIEVEEYDDQELINYKNKETNKYWWSNLKVLM